MGDGRTEDEADEDNSITNSKSSRSGRGGGLLAGSDGGVPDRLQFQSVTGMTGVGGLTGLTALGACSGCRKTGGGGRGGGVLLLPGALLRMISVPLANGRFDPAVPAGRTGRARFSRFSRFSW